MLQQVLYEDICTKHYFFFLHRNYLQSNWCLHEFYIAHGELVNGRSKYLIPILTEDIEMDELPWDMRTYLRTFTYIDAWEYDLETLRKRVRFALPGIPLKHIWTAHNTRLKISFSWKSCNIQDYIASKNPLNGMGGCGHILSKHECYGKLSVKSFLNLESCIW